MFFSKSIPKRDETTNVLPAAIVDDAAEADTLARCVFL